MTDAASASLEILFGDEITRARFRVSPGHEENLRNFALKFRTAIQRSTTSVEVDIDELLTNLVAVANWPYPRTVEWDPHLAALASDTATDAKAIGNIINTEIVNEENIDSAYFATLLGLDWKGDLTEFQRRDIVKLLSLRHGANFSVPGAGKTRVGLAVFQALRNSRGIERLLIVCPKSARESWQSENLECLVDPLQMDLYSRGADSAADAIIINYERLDGALNELAGWLASRPSMIVLDEAHRMKLGAGGTYGAACLALGPRSRHRLILTGTPAPNGVKDLENLFGFVWPGYGRQKVVQAVAGGDLAHASRVLKPLFVRTTKRELGLPPVRAALRLVPLPALHEEIYQALIGQRSARAAQSEPDFQALGRTVMYLLMAATSPALLSVGTTRYEPLAYQVPPLPIPHNSTLFNLMRDLPAYELSPKYQEVLSIVAANAKQGRKTLVWSTFVRSLLTLERILERFSPVVVHGGTKDREDKIARFRNDISCMVLLSNPATLGEGISLHHHCHDAVYVDRDFAAGRFLQSLDRIHRLGLPPDTETRITILAAAGTIDEVVDQRLGDKITIMGTILDDPTVRELADLEEEPSVGGGLDKNDVKALEEHLRGASS